MKNTKIEKNTKESDHKSGSFLFSEECYKNFKSMSFISNIQRGYVLFLMKKFYDINEKGTDYKYFGSRKLRDYSSDYEEIIKKLEDSEIIYVDRKGSYRYYPNPKYIGSVELDVRDSELYKKTVQRIYKKLEDRALNSNTENVKIEITNLEVEQELWEYEECDSIVEQNKTIQEAINYQKYLVSQIRLEKFNFKQHTFHRCYSNFTTLSSNFHKYLTINGKHLVEIDSHATYLTFLPLICRKYLKKLAEINIKKEKQLILNPEDTKIKEIIEKNDELIFGAEECIVKYENKLKELFDNKINLYDYLLENTIKKYDSCKFKKAVNSFLMANDMNKVNSDVSLCFYMLFPEIKKLVDDMRSSNYYWRNAEFIEVDIFTKAATELKKTIKSDKLGVITKFDGILVSEELKEQTLDLLYTNFTKNNIYTTFKIIEHKTGKTSKFNLSDILEIIDDFKNEEIKKLSTQSTTEDPTDHLTSVALTKNCYTSIQQGSREQHLVTPFEVKATVKATKKKRESKIRDMPDGRWTIKYNGEQINSWKGESLEEFKIRVYGKPERSEAESETISIKTLTEEIKCDIIEESPEMSLESVFSLDVEEMDNDTKTLQTSPTEPKNTQSEEVVDVSELGDFMKLILGVVDNEKI